MLSPIQLDIRNRLLVNPELWEIIKSTNSDVNTSGWYMPMPNLYDVAKFWEVVNNQFPCGDSAVTKRQRLRQLGIPAACLKLATGWRIKDYNDYCSVLLVETTEQTYVLDSKTDSIRNFRNARIRWHKIEIPETNRFAIVNTTKNGRLSQ